MKMVSTNRILVLIGLSIGTLFTPLLSTMLILALPEIANIFTVSARDIGWVSLAFILANAIFIVPGVWFVDKLGYKKSYILGAIITAAASFFSVFSPNFAVLVVLRVVTGVGVSLMMITSLAILTRIFPKSRRGLIIGINTAMVYVGLSIGPVLGGVLTELAGWHSLFLITPPFMIAAILLVALFMKEEITSPVSKFDTVGAVLYTLAVLPLMYGLATITDPGSLYLVIIGIFLAVVFIIFEMRQSAPVFHVRLFAENKRFARSSYAALLNYAAGYSVTYMMSLYLQSVGALSPLEAGLIMIFQPIVQVIATPFAGKLADRFDPKYMVTIGMVLTVFGLLAFAAIGFFKTEFITYVAIAQLLVGLGAALFSAPNSTAIMSSVSKEEYSAASGTISVVRQIGMLFSMSICMASVSLFVGGTELLGPAVHEQFIISMQVAMVVSAGLALIGVFCSWFRGPAPKVEGEE